MLRVLCLLVLPLAAHAQAPTLKHDPFVRPVLGGFRPAEGAPVARARTPALPPEDPKRILNLHAVMVAGPASIANVNGVMVRVGESVQGYRLLEVHDRAAVFEKNNLRVTLDLRSRSKTPAGK